jgi:ABC-2 type transport system permease protein
MVTLTYSLAVLGMILLPVILATRLRRRWRVGWALFLAGCATFAASQAVHLPLNTWLTDLGVLAEPGQLGVPLWRTALVLGLTAGLCEEVARLVGYALLRRARSLSDALMLGLGHGGLEAMIIGGVQTAAGVSTLLALRGADLSSLGLSPAQAAAASQQLETAMQQPWLAVLPLLERLLAMALHVTFSVMVWRAVVQRKKWWWMPVAVLAHAAVDMGAVLLAFSGVNAWLIEAALLVVTLPGILWVIGLLRREAAVTPRRVSPLSPRWRLFGVALRKEWLELKRTRRLLAIMVVFVLFGMTSPLLAYFLPQFVGSMPGAEQFAALIPTPTVADAIGQYVKNLTQFGFLLAILVGMGAVAGEKERGTAAMALSKPLPRSAYILAKFVAQAGAYVSAMLLGGVGGYYYTWILFKGVTVAGFALVTGLLIVWLLVFVAVALLGSTLARSNGASAGIGLGISVALLVVGSVPQWGALAPGGLVAWAGQVVATAAGAPSAANGGALAMSGVLIVLCLVGAVGAFERQEL